MPESSMEKALIDLWRMQLHLIYRMRSEICVDGNSCSDSFRGPIPPFWDATPPSR